MSGNSSGGVFGNSTRSLQERARKMLQGVGDSLQNSVRSGNYGLFSSCVPPEEGGIQEGQEFELSLERVTRIYQAAGPSEDDKYETLQKLTQMATSDSQQEQDLAAVISAAVNCIQGGKKPPESGLKMFVSIFAERNNREILEKYDLSTKEVVAFAVRRHEWYDFGRNLARESFGYDSKGTNTAQLLAAAVGPYKPIGTEPNWKLFEGDSIIGLAAIKQVEGGKPSSIVAALPNAEQRLTPPENEDVDSSVTSFAGISDLISSDDGDETTFSDLASQTSSDELLSYEGSSEGYPFLNEISVEGDNRMSDSTITSEYSMSDSEENMSIYSSVSSAMITDNIHFQGMSDDDSLPIVKKLGQDIEAFGKAVNSMIASGTLRLGLYEICDPIRKPLRRKWLNIDSFLDPKGKDKAFELYKKINEVHDDINTVKSSEEALQLLAKMQEIGNNL